jgi:DNA modification methylase
MGEPDFDEAPSLPLDTILVGDCREILPTLPAESIDCVVTSPPYWGLRDYGIAGQLGLEPTPEEYVEALVEVFREVRRVLRPDGTLWLNMGDGYASSGGRGDTTSGFNARYFGGFNREGKQGAINAQRPMRARGSLKPKDLIGMPWRVAFALQADGWYLRSDIVWSKPNPMPESVTDRPTKSHEYLFLLTKSARYFYDAEAVRQEVSGGAHARRKDGHAPPKAASVDEAAACRPRQNGSMSAAISGLVSQRNLRTVWTITTQPYPDAHFATFPEALVVPCILAGCPQGGVVLDPFLGSGTVAMVASGHGRRWLGIELSAEYAALARERIGGLLCG